MKISETVFLAFVSASAFTPAFASASPTRVSVTRFNQEVDHFSEGCRGWMFTEQNQLRTVLESELVKAGLKVVERADIQKIYRQEHTMENLDPSSKPKPRKFLSAQYTVTGAVSELGICEASSGSGVQLGGIIGLLGGPSGVDLDVGKKEATSRVKLVAQLVSTETGEMLQTFSAESEFKDDGVAARLGYAGMGVRHKSKSRPPIERASNQALADLAQQIGGYLASLR